MWTTLFSCFQKRYATDLRSQTISMPAEARQSLTQKIVQTLDEGGEDEEDGRENVEELLDKIELELESANQQLEQRQEKEKFLATRINKYKEMLKEQGDHLNELQKRISKEDCDPDYLELQQRRYEEQVARQLNHKVALGKVVDIHMDILKSIKDCKRTIAGLEKKKFELKNVTKKCREFLVMAEEAEREQQLGVLVDEDDDNSENDLQLMEMAPLAADANTDYTPIEGGLKMQDVDNDDDDDGNTPRESIDEEMGLELESSNLLQSEMEPSSEQLHIHGDHALGPKELGDKA